MVGGRVVVTQDIAGEDFPLHKASLQREWTRAFIIMLLLILTTAVATLVGLRAVVDQVQGPGRQLHLESDAAATLRNDLVKHEQVAHQLLTAIPVDRPAFLRQQLQLSQEFDRTAEVFPTDNGMRATVFKAKQTWQSGLMKYGLWGDQVKSLHGNHAVQNPAFGAANDDTRALLDGLVGPSLKAMDAGLKAGTRLELISAVTLGGLFMLALVVTGYFRRRMIKDLLRPVAAMRDGVSKVQSGDYNNRIAVARRDELGELAQSFNRMAEVLHSSYEALTLRATHDSLTGLANRASMTERLTASFCSGSERRTRQESLLFIDIDDFKDVNDTKGHKGGDELLRQLAIRLNGCGRPQDLVARFGGDEFAILVMEDDDRGSVAVAVAQRVLDSMRLPFIVGGESLRVSVSIGVAHRRPETRDPSGLMGQADFAMYMAKDGGKARYQLFDAQVHDEIADRSALKTDLMFAVSSGQLRLDYQPVVDLRTREIVGVEALVRWQHPTLGLLPPAKFIPLAEESGDIDAIGSWVLDTATRQVARWRQTIDHCTDLWVSVNLSALQLVNPQNLTAIQRTLADPMVQADKVVLEVTETALAADVDGGIASLTTLKRFGVRIAMDDFGTGFSSLSTLAALPIDILKIDRAFVSGQTSDVLSVAMLDGILGLANKLSLAVIAEGIEEPGELDVLRRLGCGMGQGYFLAKPAAAHVLEELLASGPLLVHGPSAQVGAVNAS